MNYLTLPECVEENARRHLLRAKCHADNGNLDYAAGSLIKAVRSYRRAREYSTIFGVYRFRLGG